MALNLLSLLQDAFICHLIDFKYVLAVCSVLYSVSVLNSARDGSPFADAPAAIVVSLPVVPRASVASFVPDVPTATIASLLEDVLLVQLVVGLK